MKNFFLISVLFSFGIATAVLADCSSLAEQAAYTAYHQELESLDSVPVVIMTAHHKDRIMLSSRFNVAVSSEDKVLPFYYQILTSESNGQCTIQNVTKKHDGVSKEIVLNEAILENKSTADIILDRKKYSIPQGLLDAAVLASFPMAYINFPRDKFYHYVAGASAALVANRICHGLIFKKSENRKLISNICGLGSAVLAGALKEFYDSRGGGNVEFNDFAATALGGAVVTVRFTLF